MGKLNFKNTAPTPNYALAQNKYPHYAWALFFIDMIFISTF